jgi:nucleotide-binding universal stress UspA family protein
MIAVSPLMPVGSLSSVERMLSLWEYDVNQLNRIVAAVDCSEPARAAFAQALALSRAHGAVLTAIQVVPRSQPFRRRARARVALLAKLHQLAESSGVRLTVKVERGDPAAVILEERASPPDLIVIGTHRRTGLDRLRRGSVAERVATQAMHPVLIVPAGSTAALLPSFGTIVVAVDFTAASNRALEQALAWAGGASGRLTAVHVVRGLPSTNVPRYWYRYGIVEYENHVVQEARRRLQDALRRAATGAAQGEARIGSGDPPAEIVRIATETDADLIVVGVTQRGPISSWMFGATAARVMRVAGRPVLAIPETPAPVACRGDERTLAA